jgi:hypothetical protein
MAIYLRAYRLVRGSAEIAADFLRIPFPDRVRRERRLAGGIPSAPPAGNLFHRVTQRATGQIWEGVAVGHRQKASHPIILNLEDRTVRGLIPADIRSVGLKEYQESLTPSVDRAKPAICRHFKTGHFR